MYARFFVATLIAISATGIGAGLTANAKAGPKPAVASFLTEDCTRQHWPSFTADCLQTVDGGRIDRAFRIVTSF